MSGEFLKNSYKPNNLEKTKSKKTGFSNIGNELKLPI